MARSKMELAEVLGATLKVLAQDGVVGLSVAIWFGVGRCDTIRMAEQRVPSRAFQQRARVWTWGREKATLSRGAALRRVL